MKRKVLVYATGAHGCQEGAQINEAIKCAKNGDDVYYLHCGKCLGGCFDNPLFDRSQCKQCAFMQAKRVRKYTKEADININIHSVDEFIDEDILFQQEAFNYSYSTIDELKKIEYKGIPIGYGALSTYISLTRNIDSEHNEAQHKYIDAILRSEVLLTLVLEKVIKSFPPDLIIFHNGRYAQFKPLLGISLRDKIQYISTEFIMLPGGDNRKNYFNNSTPHSVDANNEKYNETWNHYSGSQDRETIAKSFFENRRHAKFAGDTIYVKNQQYGKLPEGFDSSKTNIVIFNSSEDEFKAIDPEVDNHSFFSSQVEGIKRIVEHYGSCSDIHFYLRIHPNLKDIPYSYHTDLLKLEYKNLTVIRGDSDISSYSLLDVADKIVVFGSTMGIEASFWGKPVICLAYALYNKMDVVYIPKSEKDLWNLLEDNQLAAKSYKNALPYGLYYMTATQDSFEYVDCNFKYYNVLGHKLQVSGYLKIFNSNFLYILNTLFWRSIARRISITRRFKNIPC